MLSNPRCYGNGTPSAIKKRKIGTASIRSQSHFVNGGAVGWLKKKIILTHSSKCLSATSVNRSPLRAWKSDVVYKNLCKNDGASAHPLVELRARHEVILAEEIPRSHFPSASVSSSPYRQNVPFSPPKLSRNCLEVPLFDKS